MTSKIDRKMNRVLTVSALFYMALILPGATPPPTDHTPIFISVIEAYKGTILFVGAVFCILVGIIFALAFNVVRRRKAEKHLRESEARNRLLLEQADAIVWTVDKNLRFTSSQGAALTKLKLEQNQVVGQTLEAFYGPRYKAHPAVISIQKALAGQSAVYEESYRGLVWESRVEPLRNRDGTIVGCVGVSQDITERKMVEERVRASELKLRNIIEASPMGIHLYELTADDRLMFIGANAASDRLLRVNHEQFMGKTIEEAFPSLIDTEVPGRYREAARTGVVWQTEQIDYREGEIQGAFEVVAFQTEPGKMAALFNEITDRKRAEMALKESENRLKTLIENAADAFFVHDLEGHLVQVNEAACQSLGYSREELQQMSIWDIEQHIPTDSAPEARQRIVEGRVASIEGEHKRKDGSTFPVEVRVSSIRQGDQPLIFGFARDISERVEMEREKEKYQNQMIQAQKMEAIGTLAGGIAHDFNNLMMGIQGRASLMAADLERSHPSFEHLPAIMEYTRSAADLTKQLLGVAQGGRYEVKPLDLNQIVLGSATMFGRTRKEIRLHSRLQDPAPVVAVDRGQIEQVLLNILVNAWQAMPSGGEIFLETALADLDETACEAHAIPPGHYARISITDTGIGMDEATRLRIFDPFFTTKEKGRGTGLGLASAYGIIKNHGGMITVYSEPGHGTTFNIFLPLTDQPVHQEVAPEQLLIKGSETILLVDDEAMITQVGQAMLERLGYTVKTVNSGEAAVTALGDNTDNIALVILDMIMPGMDGSKTFERIRQIVPAMPVLLSSGYALDGKASEILAKGCNGFIQKPFSLPDLSRKVRAILDEKAGPNRPSETPSADDVNSSKNR